MKTRASGDPLLRLFREPGTACDFTVSDWRNVLFRAGIGNFLAAIKAKLSSHGLLETIPLKARFRLEEADTLALYNQRTLSFEIGRIELILAPLGVPLVLLKGAAYLRAGLLPARLRTASDIDLMVRRCDLPEVEQKLISSGWRNSNVTAYDDHYYRTWMHEIPPMVHPSRSFALDLHHAIAPLTCRKPGDTAALFEAAAELKGSKLRVLCPADMVLHCGTHLFNEEILLGFRDLLDVNGLIVHFSKEHDFWTELRERAERHGFERTAFYMLRYCEFFFGTQGPESLREWLEHAAPPAPMLKLMDAIFISALTPPWPNRRQPLRALGIWLLYVRSHWLKMPPHLLARHLLIKATKRIRDGLPEAPLFWRTSKQRPGAPDARS